MPSTGHQGHLVITRLRVSLWRSSAPQLGRLADQGNTIVVIEHNMDVIKCADWIIDLGPEGGDAGGTIVAQGAPEDIAHIPASYTGQFLKGHLNH